MTPRTTTCTQAIKAGRTLTEIKAAWTGDLDAFKQRREAYLLYK